MEVCLGVADLIYKQSQTASAGKTSDTPKPLASSARRASKRQAGRCSIV